MIIMVAMGPMTDETVFINKARGSRLHQLISLEMFADLAKFTNSANSANGAKSNCPPIFRRAAFIPSSEEYDYSGDELPTKTPANLLHCTYHERSSDSRWHFHKHTQDIRGLLALGGSIN